ncbi:hypothetical protein, partial [Burkholderia multivorans]|uniref:hypothetical protein n=1 Tax=Burkholderia multivorans TaxID=87883 RepID=UPI001C65794D
MVLVVGIHGDDDERPGDAGRMVGGTPLRGARTVRTIITSGARRCLHRCPPDCPRTARHRRRLPAPLPVNPFFDFTLSGC